MAARRSDRSRTIEPGRTTLALDMPGEGESVGTFRGLEAAIEQLHAAIAAAGIDDPILVGHSGSAIGAMFYAMKHPVRGIVNVDAVLDNHAFSARLRALEPQLRNGGIPAIWDELFAGMHAERCGPAGEAMLRATSRPRPDVMLGYWAPVLAPPPTAENAIADAIANLRARPTPVHARASVRSPMPRRAGWMAEHFPEAHGDRASGQRPLPPRRPSRRVRPPPRERLVMISATAYDEAGRIAVRNREHAATGSEVKHRKPKQQGGPL